jgi:hypothetical protein
MSQFHETGLKLGLVFELQQRDHRAALVAVKKR